MLESVQTTQNTFSRKGSYTYTDDFTSGYNNKIEVKTWPHNHENHTKSFI